MTFHEKKKLLVQMKMKPAFNEPSMPVSNDIPSENETMSSIGTRKSSEV
jgi:hypothetical protein